MEKVPGAGAVVGAKSVSGSVSGEPDVLLSRFEKGVSIMDQRRMVEEQERKKAELEFAHPRWAEIWAAEYPPSFDKLCLVPILQQLLDEDKLLREGRCLVPGCGRGYDVTAIASPGRYCLGVDIVPAAISSAQHRLEELYDMAALLEVNPEPPIGQCEFKCINFFELDTFHPENQFDFIFDYTFLSSLDPRIHKDWARKMSELVKVGGELMTVIYPIMMERCGGPPFQMSMSMVRELLMPAGFEAFELYELLPEQCHQGRGGDGGHNTPRTALGRWRRVVRDDDYDHEFDA